jgi:hypothetical protein
MLVDDPTILAVGWISRATPFPTGPTPASAFEKLADLCKNPWAPAVTAGYHFCEVCQYDGAKLKDEVYVPGDGCIYVAPTGILHYIAAHWYAPPTVFIQAVLDCPPMRSMDYKRALLQNGGRVLLASNRAQREVG